MRKALSFHTFLVSGCLDACGLDSGVHSASCVHAHYARSARELPMLHNDLLEADLGLRCDV